MNKAQKILWIALGTLPLPVLVTGMGWATHGFLFAFGIGLGLWIVATLVAVASMIKLQYHWNDSYPKSEYVTLGLIWIITGILLASELMMEFKPLEWIKKIPFLQEEI